MRYTRELRQAFRNEFVNVRSWKGTEERHRRGSRAVRELSEPGGPGRRGARRHRRVERHARVRRAEAQEHRGAQVRRRPHRADPGVYMLQVLALGLAGSLLGVALARAALLAVTRYAVSTSATGEPLTYGLTWPAVGQGVLIGLLVSLLFSIVPLLRVRRVRPSLLLRQERRRRRPRLLAVRRRGARRRGTGRCGGLAGRLLARRADRLRRFRRHRRSCCTAPAGCWSR